MKPAHRTNLGKYYIGDCRQLLEGPLARSLTGKVQLILTSPPFPLNRKKKYGNPAPGEYKKWLGALAPLFAKLLKPNGSIVMELGNSWVPGRPVQSLLHLESLMRFVKAPDANLRLCQEFICYNPARLPSPAQWVTVRRIRTTDSFTHLWWMAKTDFPKASNRRVLRPYSQAMTALLARGTYNNGKRPSEHGISKEGFLKNNGGSIAHNVFELESMDSTRATRLPNAFRLSNTESNDFFHQHCRAEKIVPHPARMPAGLASFFVQFLTQPGDLILDPFAGSNTTGFAAQAARRRWVAIEQERTYVKQSRIRFKDPVLKSRRARSAKR